VTILVVVQTLQPYGAERVAWKLAEAASRRSSTRLVVLEGPQSGDLAPPAGVSVRYLGRRRRGALGLLESVRLLRDAFARLRPDVVLAVLPFANVATVAAVSGMRPRLRPAVVVSEHGLYDGTRANARILEALVVRLYRRATAVACVSESVAAQLRERLGSNSPPLIVVGNPVELDATATEEVQHPFLNNGSAPLLVCVARLTPSKGHIYLLQALCQPDLDGARLLIIGDGPARAELQEAVQRLRLHDRVDFLGYRANAPAWMGAADCVVQPSLREGFGLVLVEAALMARPVAAFALPAFQELVPVPVAGYLAPVADAEGLAQAIRSCLTSARATPADTASVAKRFSADACLDRYIKAASRASK
jgi:glycosyltransferase involved in cell wall biosynthesis